MTEKQYFESKLAEIIVSNAYKNIKPVGTLPDKFKYYPTHLYKYRDCQKEYNFRMIEEEYLWADIPANFYDPTDSLVYLKLSSELPHIKRWLYSHLGEIAYFIIPPKGMQARKKGQTLQSYLEVQKSCTDLSGSFSTSMIKKLAIVEMKKLSIEKQHLVKKFFDLMESPEFENKMLENISNGLKSIVNKLRMNNKVCCLTQRRDNQKMWEEYADKYEGFVIEYDLSKIVDHPECNEVLAHTFPVKYYKRMPKVSLLPFVEEEFYQVIYNKKIDIQDAYKKLYTQLLIKKKEYCSEEEWRILSPENRIEFPVISAIYMGYKISDKYVYRLREICERKNIPLYKQEFNTFNGKMSFELYET